MKRVSGSLVVLAALVFVNQAQAQWAVFDSTNYVNALREYSELQQMYTTANQTRDQVIQAYNLARLMAQMPQNLRQRYSATFTSWKTLSAPNAFGNTSSWISAANTGDSQLASVGHRLASVVLTTPSTLDTKDPRSQEITRAKYASAELADGVTVTEIQTLGEIRSRSAALNNQITNLEQDSYSTDSAEQSEMAVLGKINSASVMQLRSQQDTNQILAAVALHQLLSSKDQFDQQKWALNESIYFQQNFPDAMNRLTYGMTGSMESISFSGR